MSVCFHFNHLQLQLNPLGQSTKHLSQIINKVAHCHPVIYSITHVIIMKYYTVEIPLFFLSYRYLNTLMNISFCIIPKTDKLI